MHRAVGMRTQRCGNENTKLWEWEDKSCGNMHRAMKMGTQSCGNGNTELWEHISVGTCTELWDHNTDTFPAALTRDGLGTAAASLSEELPEAIAAVGLLILGGELLSG